MKATQADLLDTIKTVAEIHKVLFRAHQKADFHAVDRCARDLVNAGKVLKDQAYQLKKRDPIIPFGYIQNGVQYDHEGREIK